MFVGIGFITIPIIVIAYVRINKRRDEAQRFAIECGEKDKHTIQQLREMGDRAPGFEPHCAEVIVVYSVSPNVLYG